MANLCSLDQQLPIGGQQKNVNIIHNFILLTFQQMMLYNY